MKKKIAFLLLAAILLLTVTGCSKVVIKVPADALNLFGVGPGASSSGSAAEPSSADTAAPVADTTAAPVADTTAAPAAPVSTPVADTTAAPAAPAAPAVSTTAAPAASDGKPSTKEEIINYYVTAYNKIASDAKTITRTYDYTDNYKGIVEVGGNDRLAGLAQTLMNQFMKENNEQVSGDANTLPPIGVTSLSISPSQVSAATCDDKGATYEITLKSTGTDDNYEIDPQPGQGSAGIIGPLLKASDVTDAAGSFVKFEGLHAKYPTGTVKATVDKASGHITAFRFDVPCILHFDKATALVVVSVNNTEIGLEFHQNWTIAY